MFHRNCSEYNLYLFVFLQNLLKSRVGYVKFKFPNCSFLATVLWYEPLPLHKLLITTQPGLHRIKRVRVTTGALCRTSKSFKSDTKSSKNLSPTISQKREDNTRSVGRSRKGLAGQQENRESKKNKQKPRMGTAITKMPSRRGTSVGKPQVVKQWSKVNL